VRTRICAIPIAVVALAVAAFGVAVLAENIDPLDGGSQFAWSENAGWLNAEPSNLSLTNSGPLIRSPHLTARGG
jgi:hypothetical protein